jgi:nitroimidazol reductase NimA-like FMN-containing flavoprotein (pyridoxamine 5'-phosphate oxidase superfamily)
MSTTNKQEITEYLKANSYANVATVNAGDPSQPHVSTVAYASDGMSIYLSRTRIAGNS